MAELNIFDHLKNLTINKKQADFNSNEVDKSYKPYMINRYVSMSFMYIHDVLPLNILSNIPKETHYRYLFNVLPKKSVFFNYIKGKKEKGISEEDMIILEKHFNTGTKDLELILEDMEKTDIKEICDMYKKFGKVGKK